MSSGASKPTLYERLGGVYSIAAVVDDFIDRVMHNPVLNANAAVDEAHHRVSAAGFKYYVTEMVCWATGGPQNYTGRSMSESHKHLKIEEVAAMPSGRAERVCLLPGLGGRPRSCSIQNNSGLPQGSADPFVVPWVRGKPAE